MAEHILDILKERGFIAQVTFEEDLYKQLEKPTTFYVGFDPTADSLHIGHYIPIIAMAHMQRAGHRPIALMGGGTGMIGDPSGKSDLRKMLTVEDIDHNIECFKKQMGKFLDFSDDKAIIVNNGDWLRNLNYIEFLREIGVHFSVNRMLTAECYKQRMEKGLTFLEFNYMIMQSYDFLELYRRFGCRLQLGGDDQWSNMLGGADLIRRKEHEDAFALTFKLLLTSEGKKMGKTERGALWLDPAKTSPYEFYQYWRNVGDQDVEKCLALLTFLPMDEVRRLGALKDSEINIAKTVLAYEVTKLIHGEEEAEKAKAATEALFGGGAAMEHVPSTQITKEQLAANPRVIDVMALIGLCKSKGEGRRLAQGGGVYVNNVQIKNPDELCTEEMFEGDGMLIRKGKKVYHLVTLA